MNSKILTESKNDADFSRLFDFYLQTARQLRDEMSTLFNTGVDEEKNICSTSTDVESICNMSTDRGINNIFETETIESVKNFLDEILNLEDFPKTFKPFQEFLFEDGERYSLCSCYQNFSMLNDIEIYHAEQLVLKEM